MTDSSPPEKSTVDALISALRAEGEVDSTGEFTLSREKAREKMRRFGLPDHSHYVLSLVNAAMLKGATRIHFRIDADDMEMRFDGRPFTRIELDDLYNALFSRRVNADIEALRELAIAVNAAEMLSLKSLMIRSGDGARGVEMEHRIGVPDELSDVESKERGTRIHVKSRLGARITRSLSNIASEHPLAYILRVRCQYCSLPITLNDVRISYGFQVRGAVGTLHIDSPDMRGLVGFLPHCNRAAEVLLLKYGVWFSTLTLGELTPGYFGVMEGFHIRKDISQTDAVRDEAFDRVLGAVEQSHRPALQHLCQQVLAPPAHRGFALDWSRQFLRRKLRDHLRLEELTDAPPDSLPEALSRVPFWRVYLGVSPVGEYRSQDRELTLRELARHVEAGGSLGYVLLNRFDEAPPARTVTMLAGRSQLLCIAIEDPEDVVWLDNLFGPVRRRPDTT